MGRLTTTRLYWVQPGLQVLLAPLHWMLRFVCYYSHCTTPSTGNDIHGHLSYEEDTFFPHPQGTAAAQNMNVAVETHIVSDLTEDEYFNFSVRMHASCCRVPAFSLLFPFQPTSGACSFRMGSRRRVGCGNNCSGAHPTTSSYGQWVCCNHSCANHCLSLWHSPCLISTLIPPWSQRVVDITQKGHACIETLCMRESINWVGFHQQCVTHIWGQLTPILHVQEYMGCLYLHR